MRLFSNVFVLSCIVSTLVACGGGGGGSSGGTVSIASTPVPITGSNAETVAATDYNAAISLDDASTASGSLVGAVINTPDNGLKLTDVVQNQLKLADSLFAQNGSSLATGAVIRDSVACSGGGSTSFTLNDADNNGDLSTGDTFDFSFSNCVEAGTTLQGGMNLRNMSLTGDILSFPFTLQATFTFNNLRVIDAGDSGTIDGDITISISSTDGTNFNSQLSGNSILVTSGGESERLSNFNYSASENDITGAYTISVDATVDSNRQGGRTTFVTITPFQGTGFGADPFVGEALITGANNSRVRAIVLDAVNVRLEVDADGDGAAETIIDTTWAQLTA